MNNIIIFGTGLYYEKRKQHFDNDNILFFLDNDKRKIDTYIDDVLVISPEKIKENNIEYDYIVIMSVYYEEMMCQLSKLGIPENKILRFPVYLNYVGREPSSIYYKMEESSCYTADNKLVTLVSHALDLTGAPMVLFHLAKVLKKNGYFPIVMCNVDGPLRKTIVEAGIHVIIDPTIAINNFLIWNLLMNSQFIVVNTIVQYQLIKELNGCRVPVIWWIHEVKLNYDKLAEMGVKPFKLGKNIFAFGVGRVAQKVFYDYFGYGIGLLTYGLPDTNEDKKVVFAIIGTVMPRKAQDIFIKAIEKLPNGMQDKAEFLIVGQLNMSEKNYVKEIQSKAKEIHNLEIIKPIAPEDMREFYKQIDVVVCPSREDPMPVVLVEGMMHEKVCITSDATAISDYITDGENGFVCKKEDEEDLAKKMTWLIQNKSRIGEIGSRGRQIYLNYFSEDIFSKNILDIFKQIKDERI